MNGKQLAEAVWKVDPITDVPLGTELKFEARSYFPPESQIADTLADWTQFEGVLLAVLETDGISTWCHGSAVLIGPGLALAARHVIEPYIPPAVSKGRRIGLFGIAEHGITLWRLRDITVNENDVAVLRLDLASRLPPDNHFRIASLTTRMPDLGETIMIAGFRIEESVPVGDSLGSTVRVGAGEVTALYPDGRDRHLLPHPCVEVKALTLGGMSGGPAFDKYGHCFGTLTSSINHADGPSYVSLTIPVLGAPVETVWPPGIVPLPTSILKMSSAGVVGINRPDAVSVRVTGNRVDTSYEPWS